MTRCGTCGSYIHYPVAGCEHCGAEALDPSEVEGRGVIYSFSVCYLEFGDGVVPPYVVAHVELAVQPGLRIVTNLVNCHIRDIRIDMPVRMIVVEGDQPLPFFEPDDAAS